MSNSSTVSLICGCCHSLDRIILTCPSNLYFRNTHSDPSQYASGTKVDVAPVEAQSANTNSSYQLPIDLPADDNDMMSGLIDMDSMMGLYGAGNSDDLGDWGEVTNEDFSFFDKVQYSSIRS